MSKVNAKLPEWLAVSSGIALFALGFLILFFLAFLRFDGKELWLEWLRDAAIALCIAGFIAVLFEFHHHLLHRVRTITEVMDEVMGQKVSPDVWREVKQLVEQRKVIRRNFRVGLRFEDEKQVPQGLATLVVETDYDLFGLSDVSVKAHIDHELDYQFENKQLGLPRFDYLEINPPGREVRKFSSDELGQMCARGRFKHDDIEIEARGGRPVHIHMQRTELVPCPGSYNLYSPEFIKGLQVYFTQLPPNVKVDVWVRPLGEGVDIKRGENSASCDTLLLPGHGVEIKFLMDRSPNKSVGMASNPVNADGAHS